MKRKMFFMASLAVLTLGLASAGLAQDFLSTVTPPPGQCNDKWGLYTSGGYATQQGYVTITTDCNNLTLSFHTWEWLPAHPTFGRLCVWLGNDLSLLPLTDGGLPDTSGFAESLNGMCVNATGMTTYTWTIPVSSLKMIDVANLYNTPLYIITVAEVDTDGDPNTPYETAFAGNMGQNADGGYWNYGLFKMCCSVPSCYQTAFAKGGYVWTTNPKSNPEGLPSLRLTQNRWGWAINLQDQAAHTYNIYAGAGLNNTSKGVLVGTLDVQWTGQSVTVTYHMLGGFSIEEVHIYANDVKPTKVAPGQYGYIDATPGVSSYGPVSFSVSDTNGDGIWLIGHAIVGLPCAR
jgi:hypothetical protein